MKINPMQSTVLQTPCKLSDVPIGGTFVYANQLCIKLLPTGSHFLRYLVVPDTTIFESTFDIDVINVVCEVNFLNDKP